MKKIITARSAFFNPDDFEYEVFGFWEEVICAETHKLLGTRLVDVPTYPMGSVGMKYTTLTENIVLTKSGKQVTIKASPQRSRRVITMIQAFCGKMKK